MKKLPLILLLLGFILLVNAPVMAISPYTTWTWGPGFPLPTQDAYTPLDEIDLDVSSPEEMFLAPDGYIYVADTGNGRIVKLDADFQIIAEYGQDILESPTGLFVDEEGTLYIADAGKNMIVILDSSGNLINEFGRPTEPLFGASREFLPRKIAVDVRKNLYIASEGSVNGLIMMNTSGNFIGYFGANAAEMSLKMILQRIFLTDEQLEQFIRNEAASPSNLAIDEQSLVYTITAGTEPDFSIRKFNISGRNLFDFGIFGSNSFRDIDVSNDGLFVTVDAFGVIYEYDHDGRMLFAFGGLDTGGQRLGLLSNPTSIERVGDNLYVLDKAKNGIVIYQLTDFARRLHEGVRLYSEGLYAEARPYFEEVLTYNGLIIMAYRALADADFKEGNYSSAMQNYRYGDYRRGYSEAAWELRNVVLQNYLGTALVTLFGVWVVLSIFNRYERQYKWLDPLRKQAKKLQQIRLIDDFVFMFRFIKQPADSFYYIKQNQRGSLRFAFLVYFWVLVSHLFSLYLTGFLFSPFYSTSWEVEPELEIIYALLPIILWNVSNYLIASINDGEGRVRDVIIGTAYSLFPVVLFSLPITLLSNLLTFNEAFLYTFSIQVMWVWVGMMLIIMVKEIHNYSFAETIRSILTSLFTMAMFLLIGYILYVLFNQLYEFILAIIQEAGLRA